MSEDKTYLDGKRDGKVEALEGRIDGMDLDIQGLAKSLRDEFVDRIDPISKALLGNGNPDKGLCSRFAALSNTVSNHRWLIRLIVAALIGMAVKVIVF